jgi:ornithine carbamoyltransferase
MPQRHGVICSEKGSRQWAIGNGNASCAEFTMTNSKIQTLAHKDLLSIAALSRAEIEMLFASAAKLKANPKNYLQALEGKAIVLLFEKDSLRTLVSFEVGMSKLGGRAVYLDHRQNRIGQREPIQDYAKNLERWVEAIVARTYSHATIEELARHSRVPVINALSDIEHPCQALADLFTLHERFASFEQVKLAYIGDGNNVCNSLMLCAAKLGVRMKVITPCDYAPNAAIVKQAQAIAAKSGAELTLSTDIKDAAGCNAIYTDTWTSMGQEGESAKRVKAFAGYQVTSSVMKNATGDAVFMHCLPAHRGEEVAAEVIDSEQSIIYDQAENRMHVQDAILLHLLGSTSNKTQTVLKRKTIVV